MQELNTLDDRNKSIINFLLREEGGVWWSDSVIQLDKQIRIPFWIDEPVSEEDGPTKCWMYDVGSELMLRLERMESVRFFVSFVDE